MTSIVPFTGACMYMLCNKIKHFPLDTASLLDLYELLVWVPQIPAFEHTTIEWNLIAFPGCVRRTICTHCKSIFSHQRKGHLSKLKWISIAKTDIPMESLLNIFISTNHQGPGILYEILRSVISKLQNTQEILCISVKTYGMAQSNVLDYTYICSGWFLISSWQ